MTTQASKAARLLGRKGGKARAASTTPEQRAEWARRGAATTNAATPEERSARAKAAAKARWDAKRKASEDSRK